MAPVTIRAARPEDAAAVAAIYNDGIAGRQSTFETRPRAPAEIVAWFDVGLPSWWPRPASGVLSASRA
jgi:L-amino acid N-acyltransferase YncA